MPRIDRQKRNAEIIEAYNKSKSLKEVGVLFNMNEYDVWQILKKAGVYQDHKDSSPTKLSAKEEKLLLEIVKK